MNRFNLTFSGAIIEGHDPELVKARVAQVLEIDDPALVDRYFSGGRVVLRRNLERKEAAGLYARLKRVGVNVELVKIGERGDLHSGETVNPAASRTPTAKRASTSAEPPESPEQSNTEPAPVKTPTRPATTHSRPGDQKAAAVSGEGQAASRTTSTVASREDQANKAEKKSLEAIRRADLAAKKSLLAEENSLLQDKERALQKALKAKEKEAAKRTSAAERKRKKTQAREAKHQARQEETRRKADLAARKREAADEVARRKQEQQRQRKEAAAAKQAEHSLARAQAAAERALQAAERAEQARLEEARRRAEQQEQQAQRRALEEQTITRAASELAQKPALRPVEARVKTKMETPSGRRRQGEGDTQARRKRQPGAPNLYSLTPFRNTPEIRARAVQSRDIMRRAFTGAAIALVLAVALAARLLGLTPPPPNVGADAIAVPPQGGPLMLKGTEILLHDRAGVSDAQLSLTSLGVSELLAPITFDATGRLLAPGRQIDPRSSEGDNPAHADPPQLLRCNLAESRCERFPADLAGVVVSSVAVHPQNGSLFIADSSNGTLLKVSPDGEILARAAIDLPAAPVLRLDSGLLLVNSATGPAISVFRYEDAAFGQQLDELLLQPPATDSTTYTGIRDFLWSGGHWWVLMEHPRDGKPRLNRFDAQWTFVDSPVLARGTNAAALVRWGDRTLVTDPSRIPVQRFNSAGLAEAPLVSKALGDLVQDQARSARLVQLGWRIALALCVLAALICLLTGSLHRTRSLVYRSCRERGAEPIDKFSDAIDWIDLAPERLNGLRRTGIAYTVLACGVIIGAIGMGASSLQLVAVLLVLAGPGIALLLLQRSDPGHIGVHGRELLLVDHNGLYHLGAESRIHWRGPFLMIDDVAVFVGGPFLPAFDPVAVKERVRPATAGAVRVDRKIARVKLLQARHPLALGAIAIAATTATAVLLLSLQGIF